MYMHVYVCMPKMSKVRAGRVSHPHASKHVLKYHSRLCQPSPTPPACPQAPPTDIRSWIPFGDHPSKLERYRED